RRTRTARSVPAGGSSAAACCGTSGRKPSTTTPSSPSRTLRRCRPSSRALARGGRCQRRLTTWSPSPAGSGTVDRPTSRWTLQGFDERLEAWISLDQPDEALRFAVLQWLFTRMEDPYGGVRRARELPDLWYGVVPDSLRDDHVVVCSYWINERAATI